MGWAAPNLGRTSILSYRDCDVAQSDARRRQFLRPVRGPESAHPASGRWTELELFSR